MHKKKFLLIAVLFFVFSCENDGKYIQVKVNDSIRIDSQFVEGKRENIIFAWFPPNGPHGSNPVYSIHDDHMYFTPDIEGKYHIKLVTESMKSERLGEENFFYKAIAVLSGPEAILNDDDDDDDDDKTQTVEIPEEKNTDTQIVIVEKSVPMGLYTIQFSAKENKDDAEKDKVMLENEGFNNITITSYGKYHRVRLNGFKTKDETNLISKKIKEKTGIKVWVLKNK